MSASAPSPRKFIPVVGITALIFGILFILAGATTWGVVTSQLKEQQITIPEDATFLNLGGKEVKGPLTAYAQADIINVHALAGSDGKTYAELGAEISQAEEGSEEQAELQAQRDSVMNASFLRASLFTSIVAYGVSALVIGLGFVLVLTGLAIRRLALMSDAHEAAIAERSSAV